MSDRWFFSLSAALAAGLVILALDPFSDRKPSGPMSAAGSDVLNLAIEGDNLYRFQAGNVGEIELIEDQGPVILKITLEAREAYDTPLYGPHLALDADIERNYEGRRARITVSARSLDNFQAGKFEVNYSTGNRGESGWMPFTLTREFADYSFEYDIPHADAGMGRDYIAIRPVVPDKLRTMEVRRIQLTSLSGKRPK